MPCSAACFPIAAFSSAENFSYAPLINLLLSFTTLLHPSLVFLTSRFTKLLTTSIQEDGIVFDNDRVGSGKSDSGVISFCLKYLKRVDIILLTLEITHKSINVFAGKIFTNVIQFAKIMKIFPLKNNPLYGIQN